LATAPEGSKVTKRQHFLNPYIRLAFVGSLRNARRLFAYRIRQEKYITEFPWLDSAGLIYLFGCGTSESHKRTVAVWAPIAMR